MIENYLSLSESFIKMSILIGSTGYNKIIYLLKYNSKNIICCWKYCKIFFMSFAAESLKINGSNVLMHPNKTTNSIT